MSPTVDCSIPTTSAELAIVMPQKILHQTHRKVVSKPFMQTSQTSNALQHNTHFTVQALSNKMYKKTKGTLANKPKKCYRTGLTMSKKCLRLNNRQDKE